MQDPIATALAADSFELPIYASPFPGRRGFPTPIPAFPVEQFAAVMARTQSQQVVYVADPAQYQAGRFVKGFWAEHAAQAYQFATFAAAVDCLIWLQRVRPAESLRVVELVTVPTSAPVPKKGQPAVTPAHLPPLQMIPASVEIQPPLQDGRLDPVALNYMRGNDYWTHQPRGNLFGFKR